MHVLIIEDEALLAIDLQCFLEELGAETCAHADTEAEAIRLALDRRPDLITADVNLREGTGPAAVSIIGYSIGDIPAVYVTGHPECCGTLDANTHALEKPVLWLKLVEALQSHGLPVVI